MIIPLKVEEKIRYLLRKFPATEWSGVLFTSYTGSFENGDLVITCEDIFPMDLGNTTYTEFRMNEDVAAYIADNIELFQCDIQLIHSHHQMSAFFSGTDLNTLREEGNDRNCFVSLIVNNAGTYCAAVTRKMQRKTEIVTKSLGTSYQFFGEGEVKTKEDPMSERTEVIDDEVIEYFMLDIEKPEISNPLAYLDTRFVEIENRKKSAASNVVWKLPEEKYESYYTSWKKGEDDWKELPLFNKEDNNTDAEEWTPDPKKVHKAICQMLVCSLNISDKIDLKQWVVKHMKNVYDRLFPNELALESWVDFVVEFQLDNFSDTVPEELLKDWDYYRSVLATAMYDEVMNYYDDCEYVHQYSSMLLRYANG